MGCEAAEAIVRRWLTEASLRQFFEVVDKVAAPEHWIYRRAFWNALYQNKYIDEAWVVFESNGASTAAKMFGKDISFSRFTGGQTGVQNGHSVLILRIGSLVVAEWSHSSPCSIWDESQGEVSPKLFRPSYAVSDLKKAYQGDASGDNLARQGVFWHRGSETYSWQTRIAAFIKRRRNILLRRSDYEVRP